MHILDHSRSNTIFFFFLNELFSTPCIAYHQRLAFALHNELFPIQIHNLRILQSIDFLGHLIPLILFELALRKPRTSYHHSLDVEICPKRLLRSPLRNVSVNHPACTPSKNEYGRRRSCSDVIQQLPVQQWTGYAWFWLCFQTSKWQHQASLFRANKAIRLS